MALRYHYGTYFQKYLLPEIMMPIEVMPIAFSCEVDLVHLFTLTGTSRTPQPLECGLTL